LNINSFPLLTCIRNLALLSRRVQPRASFNRPA
jgi:hypothetical protein